MVGTIVRKTTRVGFSEPQVAEEDGDILVWSPQCWCFHRPGMHGYRPRNELNGLVATATPVTVAFLLLFRVSIVAALDHQYYKCECWCGCTTGTDRPGMLCRPCLRDHSSRAGHFPAANARIVVLLWHLAAQSPACNACIGAMLGNPSYKHCGKCWCCV